jgi:AhpD family alkylhydroperoxidase
MTEVDKKAPSNSTSKRSSNAGGRSSSAAAPDSPATRPADEQLYPHPTRELADLRSSLAPGQAEAFRAFTRSVFADGALTALTKQLIAVSVAHVTQCPYCIRSHTGAALQHGATPEQIMEAIWVAAEMRAGGAYAHSNIALDVIEHHRSEQAAPKSR